MTPFRNKTQPRTFDTGCEPLKQRQITRATVLVRYHANRQLLLGVYRGLYRGLIGVC